LPALRAGRVTHAWPLQRQRRRCSGDRERRSFTVGTSSPAL